MGRIGKSLILLTLISGILFVCPVGATVLPPNSAETQGILVFTDVLSSGFFSHVTSLRWDLSSEALGVNVYYDPWTEETVIDPEPPLNEAWEVQMRCSYLEDTDANNGVIDYTRNTDIDTAATVRGGSNVENKRLVAFEGYDGGRFVSTEDTVMDTVGTCIPRYESTLCPLDNPYEELIDIPPFCNFVQTGSLIDMSTLSASTTSTLRNVNPPGEPGFDPPMPSADNPAVHHYDILVTGRESGEPAMGIVSSYSRIHSLEGGEECPGFGPAQEINFEEYREVNGNVSHFSYLVEYESGIIR